MKKEIIAIVMMAAVSTAFVSCGKKHVQSTDETPLDSMTVDSAAILDSTQIDSVPEETTAPSYLASLQPKDVILPSELRGCVKIINGEDNCIPVDMDDNGYPEITITFKLIRSVDTSSLASEYGQLWIIGLPQDAAGRDVHNIIPNYNEWRTQDSDGKDFKAFLEGDTGSTITMTFTGSSNVEPFEEDQTKIQAGRDKTEAACKKVAKFKLAISSGI